MKIAISAQGTDLSAQVDPRFGRCQYFVIVDPETMQFETLENSNIMAGGGAGIATAQMIANKGIQVVITGNCGPNAYQTLSAAGVRIVTGVGGTVKEAIEGYKAGQFQSTSEPTVDAHFGMGIGPGTGMGGGAGRGMSGGTGKGTGRGMSRGRGMGRASPGAGWSPMHMAGPLPQPMGLEQEVQELRTQVQMLGQQLDKIQRHIEEHEKKGR